MSSKKQTYYDRHIMLMLKASTIMPAGLAWGAEDLPHLLLATMCALFAMYWGWKSVTVA